MEYATGILVLRTHNTGCESDNGALWFCSRGCIDWAVQDGFVAAAHVEFPDLVTSGYQLCMQCNCPLPEAYLPGHSEPA